MNRKVGRIIGTICISILTLLLLAIVGLYLFGYRAYAVQTGSMTPEIRQGALVFSKKIDANLILDKLQVGEDITYKTNNGVIVTHRIINIDKENGTIQCRGIKENSSADAPITPNQVLGKVSFDIPLIGFLVILLKNIFNNIYLLITLIFVIVIIFVSKALIKEMKKNKTNS